MPGLLFRFKLTGPVRGVLVALLVIACDANTGPVSPAPLPMVPPPDLCRGVGLDATLVGDPRDPRLVWLDTASGVRKELVWPPGYQARFDPTLEVLDPRGSIVFRAGDHVDEGCTMGPAHDPTLFLLITPQST